jgi:tetratricopeptide (TPR) repeat protein
MFERVFESISRLERTLERERQEAPGLLRRMEGQPLARQLLIVRNLDLYHTAGLCEEILERSWTLRFDEPARTRDLAELAVVVAEALDLETYGRCLVQDLRGRAWCHLGNARRIVADLRGAAEAFQKAERHLAEGSGDKLERGFLLRTRALLLLDQRRLEESETLMDQALDLYRSERADHEVGMALLAKSHVRSIRGDAEGTISYLKEALSLLDLAREPRAKLVGVHNLAYALHDLGRDPEAIAVLIRWRFLYFEFGDRAFLLRLHWLEGLIARGLERPELAEGALQEARRGFLELSLPYEMALVSLDLAELYLETGETGKVATLATEAAAFFQSRQIHRDALAAFLLLRDAAGRDQVTLDLVRKVGEFLEASRNDPEQRFRSRSDA